jgi:hypothetical protein
MFGYQWDTHTTDAAPPFFPLEKAFKRRNQGCDVLLAANCMLKI